MSLGKLVISFERDGANETDVGVFVLQDADDLGGSFEFAVRTLLRRGGINLPPIIREDIPSPGSGEIGKLLAWLGGNLAPICLGGPGVVLGVSGGHEGRAGAQLASTLLHHHRGHDISTRIRRMRQ